MSTKMAIRVLLILVVLLVILALSPIGNLTPEEIWNHEGIEINE